MPQPSLRGQPIPFSPIRTMFRLADEMERAGGGPVFRLHVGDPDFAPPASVIEATAAALRTGRTHYAPTAGVQELRLALAEKARARNGLAASTDQVIITPGSTQALFATLNVMFGPGQEVLVPEIYWPNYVQEVLLLGGRPQAGMRRRAHRLHRHAASKVPGASGRERGDAHPVRRAPRVERGRAGGGREDAGHVSEAAGLGALDPPARGDGRLRPRRSLLHHGRRVRDGNDRRRLRGGTPERRARGGRAGLGLRHSAKVRSGRLAGRGAITLRCPGVSDQSQGEPSRPGRILRVGRRSGRGIAEDGEVRGEAPRCRLYPRFAVASPT